MAYIEHDQLDAQLKKLENVCAENGFTYKFLRDKMCIRDRPWHVPLRRNGADGRTRT